MNVIKINIIIVSQNHKELSMFKWKIAEEDKYKENV